LNEPALNEPVLNEPVLNEPVRRGLALRKSPDKFSPRARAPFIPEAVPGSGPGQVGAVQARAMQARAMQVRLKLGLRVDFQGVPDEGGAVGTSVVGGKPGIGHVHPAEPRHVPLDVATGRRAAGRCG